MTNNEHTALIALIDTDDDHYIMIRSLMIDFDANASDDDFEISIDELSDLSYDDARNANNLLAPLFADAYSRDLLTDLALRLTLCPLHFIDYAICFDDDDTECAAIRIIHPSHDS